jgi:hypothetical protein
MLIATVMVSVIAIEGRRICGFKAPAKVANISPILINPPTKATLLTILLQCYVLFIYSSIATWYPDKTWKFFGAYKRSVIGG